MDGKTATASFYNSMNVAQIGGWICTSAWALHFMLSLCGLLSFRRHGATPRDIEMEEKKKKEKKEKAKKEKKEKKEKKQSEKKVGGDHRVSAWERDQSTARLV